jgi:hypothetical protein
MISFRVRVSLVGPNFEETYPENQILFFQGAAKSASGKLGLPLANV